MICENVYLWCAICIQSEFWAREAKHAKRERERETEAKTAEAYVSFNI